MGNRFAAVDSKKWVRGCREFGLYVQLEGSPTGEALTQAAAVDQFAAPVREDMKTLG